MLYTSASEKRRPPACAARRAATAGRYVARNLTSMSAPMSWPVTGSSTYAVHVSLAGGVRFCLGFGRGAVLPANAVRCGSVPVRVSGGGAGLRWPAFARALYRHQHRPPNAARRLAARARAGSGPEPRRRRRFPKLGAACAVACAHVLPEAACAARRVWGLWPGRGPVQSSRAWHPPVHPRFQACMRVLPHRARRLAHAQPRPHIWVPAVGHRRSLDDLHTCPPMPFSAAKCSTHKSREITRRDVSVCALSITCSRPIYPPARPRIRGYPTPASRP